MRRPGFQGARAGAPLQGPHSWFDDKLVLAAVVGIRTSLRRGGRSQTKKCSWQGTDWSL